MLTPEQRGRLAHMLTKLEGDEWPRFEHGDIAAGEYRMPYLGMADSIAPLIEQMFAAWLTSGEIPRVEVARGRRFLRGDPPRSP